MKFNFPAIQEQLSRLFSRIMKRWSWIFLIVFALFIKGVSLRPDWVETYYSNGLYPVIANIQRFLFGWLPVSVGDILYGLILLVIIYKTFDFFLLLFQRKLTKRYFIVGGKQLAFSVLFVYVFFNLFWGLNYNRKGIAEQVGIRVDGFSVAELDTLTGIMMQRVNHYAELVSLPERDSLNKKRRLFSGAVDAYMKTADAFPILRYTNKSVKPSIFSYAGNYLGFQGYYNPITGEAQVNTTVPRFLEPFITTHEIAHQLGYARENEANFVGYLACRNSPSIAFRYSVYYDMYSYSVGELYRKDSLRAKHYQSLLHPRVRKDQETFHEFLVRYQNPIEPVINWAYNNFLKANNQPAGQRSYDEVVSWLIAYARRYGDEAL